MKATELIAKLTDLVSEHGDLDTIVSDFGCGCCGGFDLPAPSVYEVGRCDPFEWDARHLEVPGTKVFRLND